MRQIYIIAHDMRSTHNVGSLFRTAEGLGITKLFLTGYTPHPGKPDDDRLPHIVTKLEQQIQKTALGAQASLPWQYSEKIEPVLKNLRDNGVKIIALEQTKLAIELHNFEAPDKVALVLGTEVKGLPQDIIDMTDQQVVIPMYGHKESFNVVQASAMAMYHLRFSRIC